MTDDVCIHSDAKWATMHLTPQEYQHLRNNLSWLTAKKSPNFQDYSLERKSRHGDCHGHHWRRWRQACGQDISACKSLTHWGRATHIWFSKLTIIASDNGLSPGRRQAIIWNNAGILSIGLLGTNFSEILIEILTFSFKKIRLKVSSAKWRPFCLGLNELIKPFLWTSPVRTGLEQSPRRPFRFCADPLYCTAN